MDKNIIINIEVNMKKEIRTILLLWSGMLILGCLIVHLFFSIYKHNQKFVEQSSIVTADIIKTTKNNNKIIPIYDHQIKYMINNKEYEGIISSVHKYKNMKIEIFYQIDNPGWIMEKTGIKRHLIILIISLIFPLFALINIINILHNNYTNYRLKKQNNVVIAPISKIEKNKNRWFPYCLECTYNGQVYETPMTAEHNSYINYNKIDKIKLYLGKSNYYIDVDSLYEKKEG